MKKIPYILLPLFLLCACKKQLNLYPLDAVSTANFFKTTGDYDLALNGLYDDMQGHGQGGLGGVYAGDLYWEVASDGMYFGFSWHTPYYDISNGNLAPSTGNLSSLWDSGYKAISWSNTILQKVDGNSALDAAFAKHIKGEALFLRAATYLRLVSVYGDVPLVLTTLNLANSKVSRTPADQVYQQIVADFDAAAQLLDVTPYNGQKGRATKQAALGMKARALIYAASPLFNTSNDLARWKTALAACQAVVDLAGANANAIGLIPNYSDVFSLSNEDNKEILFNIEYTSNNSSEGGNNELPFGPSKLSTQSGVAGSWGAAAIVPEYADSYLMKDGLTAATSPFYSAANPFLNRDPRFYTTFFLANYTVLSDGSLFYPFYLNSFAGSAYRTAYPISVRKGIDENAKNQSYDNEQAPNFIVLRYADVLLMLAEAENEVNGPTAKAYSAVNQIRQRAAMPILIPGLSQADLRTAIMNERKWELGYESVRYFDIRRWKTAETVMNSLTKAASFGIAPPKHFYAPKNYFWPIATNSIDADPNLKQNTGY
ncbi:RagB/SusD family nutrient uptake outer membrane protein [Mucilaginibacter sp. SJ]|uniref:RagB/SusD family nutrient uptake outer membrane protein n=1 Tax=Mucilaginibacter sp. SJ TaxID=3029053 RepID=UPI0023A935E8|nr:RagB/SusD family nutrient uptake outer membrane protein [Mucilaginibacter sp. SJ]WEA00593.1 RagB/SusD family nutrient uptake outer membrane protein [Mucilaginibacter sp. SJ]